MSSATLPEGLLTDITPLDVLEPPAWPGTCGAILVVR